MERSHFLILLIKVPSAGDFRIPEERGNRPANSVTLTRRLFSCFEKFRDFHGVMSRVLLADGHQFVGWGGEDDAMTMKVELARLSTCELDPGPAMHLWHPRAQATTDGHPDYASNLALLADYARYDEATLARLFEVQRQIHGRRDKYAPDAR